MKFKPAFVLYILAIFAQAATAGGNTNNVVSIKDFAFTPQEITIKRGETVRWQNIEKVQYHSVWFEALGEEAPDYIFPDESYEREFKETGSFPYHCEPHPRMTGTVNVVE